MFWGRFRSLKADCTDFTDFNTYVFLHFVSQGEIIASEVIPSCEKLIVRVSYLFCDFFVYSVVTNFKRYRLLIICRNA